MTTYDDENDRAYVRCAVCGEQTEAGCGCRCDDERDGEEDEGCYAPEYQGRCCCNCRYHLRDHSHPLTNGGVISQQRGWICDPPELDMAFSGWSEHGMCEMHDREDEGDDIHGTDKRTNDKSRKLIGGDSPAKEQ